MVHRGGGSCWWSVVHRGGGLNWWSVVDHSGGQNWWSVVDHSGGCVVVSGCWLLFIQPYLSAPECGHCCCTNSSTRCYFHFIELEHLPCERSRHSHLVSFLI